MTTAYAVEADLEAFLPASVGPVADAARLLERAAELLDDTVRRPFAVDSVTKLPTDPDIAEAMKQASCAIIEYWLLGPGEEHDVEGMHGRRVSIGHLSVNQLPDELAPRAVRILHTAGMLSSSDIDSTAFRFFATQSGS